MTNSDAKTFEPTGIAAQPIRINLRVLAIAECLIVGFVILTGTASNYIITQVATSPESSLYKLFCRFDLGHEPSLPQFVSAVGHVSCSCLLFFLAFVEWKSKRPIFRSWFMLGCVFIYLSIDESIMIHEMFNRPLREHLGLGEYFFFPWVLVALAAVVIVGFASLKLLRFVDSKTRWLFVIAGIVFVSGAVGMELVAGVIFADAGSEELGVQRISHVIAQAIEEGMELSGISIFFWAIVNYIRQSVGSLRISIA